MGHHRVAHGHQVAPEHRMRNPQARLKHYNIH